MKKKNYKFTIEYDGTKYFGWEHQPNTDMTIQGKIETVLSRMCQTPVEVIGAGRTDAGVHAKKMTANAFLETQLSISEIQNYLNRYLPEDICVLEVTEASDRFHSRYNAVGKTYCYSCYCGNLKPVFNRKYVTVINQVPDMNLMRAAAVYLTGKHDYFSLCSNPKMKKSTVRIVDKIEIAEKNGYIRFTVHGTGFLQNMVRILVGTLLEAGYGHIDPSDIPAILDARDRTKAGPTMPPQGLSLIEVDYN